MVITIALMILIALIGVAAIFIAFDESKNKKTKEFKWIRFIIAVLVTLFIASGLIALTLRVSELPYLTFVSEVLDILVFTFIGYLPKNLLIFWFLFPVVVVWIYFLLKTGVYVMKSRKRYKKWKERQAAQAEQENSIFPDEINVHFLKDSMMFTNINYNSVLGLQRAYEVAKKEGMQIQETETGYAAVFSSQEGLNDLKALFSKYRLAEDKLPNRPAIVFFNDQEVSYVGIKSALDKLSRGEKIG